MRSRKDLTVRVSAEQFVDAGAEAAAAGGWSPGHDRCSDQIHVHVHVRASGGGRTRFADPGVGRAVRARASRVRARRHVRLPSSGLRFAPATYAGVYADDFSALSARTRSYDEHPESVFSYCARNTAVYECLSYAADGTIRRNRQRSVLHGTAFAYQRQGNDTLLLTNDHVAAWPSVTDSAHPVDGIPGGCKLVSQSLTLVDNEHDDYPRDDVPLTVVVTDPPMDVAILRAHAPLQIMPWKIGRSADLRERNVVEVRGFPLGAFRATNIGKVVSAHDHDDYGDWDHDDFVVDALLSAGNSGSPVLAVSRVTGEYELVGVFHAGYSQGSALNVVIGIDQVRDLMTTLKRSAPEHQPELVALNGARDEDRTSPWGR